MTPTRNKKQVNKQTNKEDQNNNNMFSAFTTSQELVTYFLQKVLCDLNLKEQFVFLHLHVTYDVGASTIHVCNFFWAFPA